jgi:predicted O-methyltransferase YrrM
VKNTTQAGQITGKISANPNPVSFGQGSVTISWETNDPSGAEIRVSTGPDDEKPVSQVGRAGQMEVPWIVDSKIYDFRLYAASWPDKPIDSVKVKRDLDSVSAILRKLATEAMQGNINITELSQFIAAIMPHCLHSGKFQELFPVWEQHGFHVTPVHFYQPIPDTRELPETLWKQPSDLVGIDMNDAMQLDLLRNHFTKFREECRNFPAEPPPGQRRPFRGVDALVAYCMVRHFQPRLIIEVGSGFSSLALGQAAAKNKNSALICVDPFPNDFLRKGFPGLRSSIKEKIQDINLKFFSQLQSGDILFIDSSHTVKIGGDVNYLFLEVLPRLKPGVIVHVHDIFLPFEYRRDWVLDEFRFWNEQYLLQAFLTFNSEFEVLLANSYLNHYHQEDLKAAFRNLPSWAGGSFWMRRKPSVD